MMRPVCEGNGVEDATYHIPEESHIHPVIILTSGHNYPHIWNNYLPEEWLPSSVHATELVLCVEEEKEELIQRCQYHPVGSFSRYQYYIPLRLLEARTGKIVSTYKIWGGIPPFCPYTLIIDLSIPPRKETGNPPNHGSHVKVEDEHPEVKSFLSRFVLPMSSKK